MSPYIEPPDIPDEMTISAYRRSRNVEPMRPRRGILRKATRQLAAGARHSTKPNHRRTAA